jgi:glyoxylase-like metal-dependent hydrolase (beta-lactamase superfamily II)
MYGVDYKPVKVDTILKGEREEMLLGDLKFNFLHTPGHTPGSISVYIDTKDGRVLFGQDIHGPFSPAWGSNLEAWRESMHKLIDLKADVLCEGHAGVYRGKEIEEYIESCLERFSSA